ncbi:hypothetical protein BOX15_Mlig000537g1 [Macrostomum lignano]|uniref:EGF-like domain-containing protein n=1 Tax=Macrostomum lignano TaxID=282301 RepID=A0A267ERY1_9PLAT|nr:hypothetical protein BOX15_Mlig000537g1 [Macrostomum lignano]
MLTNRLILLAVLIGGCLGFNETDSLFDIGGDDLNFVDSPTSMRDNFQYAETDILEELYNTTRVTKRSTRSNLCTYQRSKTQYYRSRGSWWRRRQNSRTVIVNYQDCCPGWSRYTGEPSCLRAICFGRLQYCPNGGSCNSPDFCSNCNPTHYSPRCDLCPQVPFCALTYCTHLPSAIETMTCQICMFDHGPKGQAYKLSSDRKACIETCSWRREHNLCFPGVCNGYHTECQCDAGFTSTPGARDCLKIVTKPTVLTATMTVRIPPDGTTPKDDVTIDFHKSPNSVNYINTKPAPNRKIQLEWTATSRFKPTISSPGPREHFIPPSGYKIGLVRENFVFVLSGNQNFPDNSIGPLEETGISPSNPKLAERAFTGQLNQLPPAGWQLQSGHSLKYTYSVYNGGFVTVADLDARGATHPRFLTGESFTQAGTFVFDYSLPYHCTVAGHGARPCTQPFDQRMLELSEAFTKQNQINGKFGGWRDDHAGVLQYDIELKLMHKVGEVLKENEMVGSEHKIIDLNGEGEDERRNGGNREFSVHFDLPPDEPSVYTVVVTVRDAVRNSIKNVRRSRRFFIFDNSSSVESRDERYPLGVDDTVNNRGLWWLRRLDGNVAFRWTDNLINELHTGQGFLLPIEHVPEFYGDGYDQTSGPRSIHPIENVHGVVRFASQFGVDAVGGRSLQQPDQSRWLTTTDIHAQMQSFRFDRRDGESAKFWVIGEDVMGNSRVNSFLMHIDSSPAELGTLSLTNRGVEGSLCTTAETYTV